MEVPKVIKTENEYEDKDIFIRIWFNPKSVFKYVNNSKVDEYVYLLLILAGIGRALDRAVSKDLGDTMSLSVILGFCILLGGGLGWLTYYIYAGLLSWTGRWLKGKSDLQSILRIIAYALIPAICSLVLWILQIIIYGKELFKSDADLSSARLLINIIFYTSLVIEIVLALWSFVLLIIGLSVVQRFSIYKAIINLILPFVVIFVPLYLLLFGLDVV